MDQKRITYRHNILHINSMEAFGNIAGGLHQGCRDVYFVRALGMGAHYREDVLNLDAAMAQHMRSGKLVYKRIDALPVLMDAAEAGFYAGCCAKWQESQNKCMETKCTGKGMGLADALGCAAADTVGAYRRVKPNLSETMEKNFAIKLAYWFDRVMENFLESWDERSSIKLAVQNVAKEQEYLFCYMLTLVGADVLLLQSRADIALAQQLKDLSVELYLGAYAETDIPRYEMPCAANTLGNTAFPAGSDTPSAQTGAGSGAKIRIVMPARPGRKTGAPQPIQQFQSPPAQPQPPRIQLPRHVSSAAQGTAHGAPRISQGTAQRAEKSFEELALLASSVVMITIHGQDGRPMGSGSGIMIGRQGYILTNSHVACRGNFYTVKIEDDDTPYQTDEIIKYNQVYDLAVIRIRKTLTPIPVYKGTQKLVRGQRVVAIGSPLGLFNSVSDGIISGFRKIDDVDMIQFTAPTSHGSSGGAVLNMYGEVIGISTAGIDDGQNINLAMGYECINAFIRGFE